RVRNCLTPKCPNPRRSEAAQAKYCEDCFRDRKRQNSLESRTYEMRKAKLCPYMRRYRKDHPGLSTPYVQKFRNHQKNSDSSFVNSLAAVEEQPEQLSQEGPMRQILA